MANLQKAKNEALATIDAALAILNKFPDIQTADSSLSFNTSGNPFEFLMDCFKNTAGYNILINILSKFIMIALPGVEIAVKGVLLANIKNILSCSINPFISEDILLNGIIFNLEQIDITDTLRYCPTDNKGKYYYFDNDHLISDLRFSKDFNCLLWYVKNKASFREVWGQKDTGGNKWNIKADTDNYWNLKKNKCRKGAGIVTLEFNARSQGLLNAVGSGMAVQTPYNNCIHVFLGNTKEEYDGDLDTAQEKYFKVSEDLNKEQNNISSINAEIDKLNNEKTEYEQQRESDAITQEQYESLVNDADNSIKEKKDAITGIEEKVEQLKKNKEGYLQTLKKGKLSVKYRSIKENYYHNHTLLEFNTDYVMSLKLFDAKVVTAQLIDSLVGLMNIDLDLSYKQMLIKNEIQKMVKMVVDTDDTTVSDCFFTFTNDDYNAMLEKAEMNKLGLFSINGEQNVDKTIDVESILSSLNEIDDSAIQSCDTTVIEHALTDISKTISTPEFLETDELNFGVQMNFIENLMNNLAYVIANAVLSPKVYLLILINLEILGRDTNFSLEGFIDQFKQLIVSLIRTIRDQLLKFLVDELMKLLGDIAAQVAIKIGIEQALYYARLIKKIIDCFKRKGTTLDFDIANVDYADIVEDDTNQTNNEC